MDNHRCNRWSRVPTVPARLAHAAPMSPRCDALASALAASALRRSVLGALLAALLTPWLAVSRVVARQEEICPCSNPPCFLRAWGRDPRRPGQLAAPFGVAVAPDRTVYIADSDNHRIQVFDAVGTYRGRWGGEGSGDGQFNRPLAVAVAPDGTVYVADQVNNRIQAFCVAA